MGFLQDLGQGLTGGASGIIGGAMNLAGTLITAKKNRDMQIKENQKDREFNAAEAEKQRNFEEQMYVTHESPLAQAQARQNAGLNPTEGISSQSVGGGSTASAHSSSLPPGQAPSFEFISQLPLLSQQIRSAKLDNESKVTDNAIKKQQLVIETNNAIKSALEAGKYEEALNLQMESLRQQNENARMSAEKLRQEAERHLMDNEAYREFRSNGGNQYEDASNVSKSQTLVNDANARYITSLEEFARNQDSRQAEMHVVNMLKEYATVDSIKALTGLHNAQASQALSQIEVNNANIGKINAEAIKITNDDERAALASTLDNALKEIEKQIKLSDKTIKDFEVYRTRVMNGDVKNFNDFMNGLAYHVKDALMSGQFKIR